MLYKDNKLHNSIIRYVTVLLQNISIKIFRRHLEAYMLWICNENLSVFEDKEVTGQVKKLHAPQS